MATTTTTNLGLVKPDYNEAADVAVLNQNADKIDAACGKYQNAMAIVANGNTHGAITSGQYVYVSGHSTLAEGLYTAAKAIPANTVIDSTYLTAVSGGGLNVLRDNIDTRTLAIQNSDAIAAGAVKSFRIGTAYTGYTPIGIVSIFGSGTSGLVLQEFYLDGTDAADAVIYYRNATSNSITPTLIRATILYRRN